MRTDAATPGVRADWLAVDDTALRDAAARGEPFRFPHTAGAFLDFAPSALIPLTRRLPPAWVTVNDGALPRLCPPVAKLDYADAATALHDLPGRCLSVRLYHVNNVPPFSVLVRDVLDQTEAILGDYGQGMSRRDASLFCGSPGSNVPLHADRHDNLLLQLVGTKQVTIATFRDPARQLAEIERNFGDHLNLCTEPDDVRVIELGPGEGVFIPPYTIHGVRCGPDPSTALSASFSTVASDRAELVHLANRRLRRLHVRPRGPGHSELVDRAKATGFTWARRLKHGGLKTRPR